MQENPSLFASYPRLVYSLGFCLGTKPFQSRCGAKTAAVFRHAGDCESAESWFSREAALSGFPSQVKVMVQLVGLGLLPLLWDFVFVCVGAQS